ncbi:cyclin-dependent kinase inhibitor 3 family protein [Rhodobacter sp. Har01]|uniref:cyclin-dependent kinase inhibitor 3 family protein n=1 Tax=Rhodobacter sp. Har01 TaxID=2883999 RepID=UPI001D07A8DF|nr:cyclin-dependent kinase inhibitor 3 family protein [Rhodobacter sp. Har01]MCB6178926.1 cyclin-dependent kinase inhibitor 3 family protein [Rhodobacter sp. Har01]
MRAAPAHGRIGITFCPGKHDPAAATGAWARDLSADLDVIAAWGARLVLTLVEPAELAALKVPHLGAEVRNRGLDWRHLPIRDYSVPSADFERDWLTHGRDIRAVLRSGGDVVVHCRGGLGRAGMIAARLLAELGVEPEAAIREVRRARKGAIETPAQLALVRRTASVFETDVVDTSRMTKIGAQLGSNPGGLYRDATGQRFYVKSLDSPAQALNERLAARLYQLAGAPTLRYLPARHPNEVATAFVDLDKRHLSQFSAEERRQAQRWFGVHAWTANWDAAGFDGENQGVTNGVVLTLDVGGALEFRAGGDPKGKAFGTRVHELDRLRSDRDNPHAVLLFGDMDAAAIDQAVGVVTGLADDAIRRVVAQMGGKIDLAEKLIARKADMARATG